MDASAGPSLLGVAVPNRGGRGAVPRLPLLRASRRVPHREGRVARRRGVPRAHRARRRWLARRPGRAEHDRAGRLDCSRWVPGGGRVEQLRRLGRAGVAPGQLHVLRVHLQLRGLRRRPVRLDGRAGYGRDDDVSERQRVHPERPVSRVPPARVRSQPRGDQLVPRVRRPDRHERPVHAEGDDDEAARRPRLADAAHDLRAAGGCSRELRGHGRRLRGLLLPLLGDVLLARGRGGGDSRVHQHDGMHDQPVPGGARGEEGLLHHRDQVRRVRGRRLHALCADRESHGRGRPQRASTRSSRHRGRHRVRRRPEVREYHVHGRDARVHVRRHRGRPRERRRRAGLGALRRDEVRLTVRLRQDVPRHARRLDCARRDRRRREQRPSGHGTKCAFARFDSAQLLVERRPRPSVPGPSSLPSLPGAFKCHRDVHGARRRAHRPNRERAILLLGLFPRRRVLPGSGKGGHAGFRNARRAVSATARRRAWEVRPKQRKPRVREPSLGEQGVSARKLRARRAAGRFREPVRRLHRQLPAPAFRDVHASRAVPAERVRGAVPEQGGVLQSQSRAVQGDREHQAPDARARRRPRARTGDAGDGARPARRAGRRRRAVRPRVRRRARERRVRGDAGRAAGHPLLRHARAAGRLRGRPRLHAEADGARGTRRVRGVRG